uniref:Uncharacterized protein n=1 Tax=Arundo donax TaxID=35708 RepID=A0A0A9GW18_ARUDO
MYENWKTVHNSIGQQVLNRSTHLAIVTWYSAL